MKTQIRCLVALLAGGLTVAGVLADENAPAQPAPAVPPPPPSIFDNLYLDAGFGAEKPPGEDSTAFGSAGVNWGIPLTPPGGVALGLQLGGSLKVRDDDPEWNGTIGGFGRNFATFPNQRGALAVLFDYRRTAFHNELWELRPILGTTISPQDALGVEIVGPLHGEHGQQMIGACTGFWTRNWTDQLGSELGLGYQFSGVDEALLRGRLAYGLTRNVDIGFGGDLNTEGNYAGGLTVSYHFGGTGRHATLHNIGGTGNELYTPFPDADFPMLLHRTR